MNNLCKNCKYFIDEICDAVDLVPLKGKEKYGYREYVHEGDFKCKYFKRE